jgi:proteasome beta subunit
MTLVLAIKAADGVVLASDSQATAGADAVRTRGPARKLYDLHGRIAFGCSGSSGLRQRVVAELQKQISASECRASIDELRPRIREIVNPLQQTALAEHVALGDAQPSCLSMLFAGVTEGCSWIYEIAADGKDEEHESAEAIGGARHYAIHGMVYHQHLGLEQRPLNQVRLAAYRILLSTILADGTGAIGVPIQVYEARNSGVQLVTDNELKAMHDALNGLKEQERDLWVRPAIATAELSEELLGGIRLDETE